MAAPFPSALGTKRCDATIDRIINPITLQKISDEPHSLRLAPLTVAPGSAWRIAVVVRHPRHTDKLLLVSATQSGAVQEKWQKGTLRGSGDLDRPR